MVLQLPCQQKAGCHVECADIVVNNNKLNVVETFKYRGVTFDSRLNWEPHISQLIVTDSPK